MDSTLATVQHTFEAVSTLGTEKSHIKQNSYHMSHYEADHEQTAVTKMGVKSESSETQNKTTTHISHNEPSKENADVNVNSDAPEDHQKLEQSQTSAFVIVQNKQKSTKQRDFANSPVINILAPMKNNLVSQKQKLDKNKLDGEETRNVANVESNSLISEKGETKETNAFQSTATRNDPEGDTVFKSTEKSSTIVLPPPPSSPPPPLILEEQEKAFPPVTEDLLLVRGSRGRVKKKSKSKRPDIRSQEDSANINSLRDALKKRSLLNVDLAEGELSDHASNRSGHSTQIHALEELNTYLRDQADIDTQSEKSVVETSNYDVTPSWNI